MTRIFVLGSTAHASRIARFLDMASADFRATFVPTRQYPRLLALSRRSTSLVVIRAGFRPGSATPRGRGFDAYWSLLRRRLPRATFCHYWIGSDVWDSLESARDGTLRPGPFADARDDLHLAVAPWLTEELQALEIEATTALLPAARPCPSVAPELPREFTVLTYAPAERFAYYGGDVVLEAARRLPDVRFQILGMRGEPRRPPTGNVEWLGWQDRMAPVYAGASVVVRIPAHDGFGNTVIEGLLTARHVVYRYPVPHTRTVAPPTFDRLVPVLTELRDAHAAGRLMPNSEGRAYALVEFEPGHLADRLCELISNAVREGGVRGH